MVLTVLLAAGCHGDHEHDEDGGHDHGDHDHGTHADGDAGHDHGDAAHRADGGHQHEDGGGHHDLGVAPDLGNQVQAVHFSYCDCMLLSCHDPFHDRWGPDDVEARNACAEEVSMLPREEGAQSGANFDCWKYQCEQVAAGAGATCDDALGAACQP